jgi:PAS domain S-box-containing protein
MKDVNWNHFDLLSDGWVDRDLDRELPFSESRCPISNNFQHFTAFYNFYQNSILELLKNPENYPNFRVELDGQDRDGSEQSDQSTQIWQSLKRAIACYLWQEDDRAIEWLDCLLPDLNTRSNELEWLIFYIYDALSRLATYDRVSHLEQPRILERVEVDVAEIQRWVDRYPNYALPDFELVSAELNRVRGQKAEAIENFDRALTAAQNRGDLRAEALTNELAGRFYLTWGKSKIADVYLTDAYQLYDRLGARAKAENVAQSQHQELPLPRKTSIAGDWVEALQLSQTLSGSLRLDQLLVALMQMAIEKTEADVGISILVEGEGLSIAARCVRQNPTADFPANCNLQSVPIETATACVLDVPQTVIDYVRRTKKVLILTETTMGNYATDPYFGQRQPKSLLCLPTIDHGKMKGMIYLENHTRIDAFSGDRLEILQLLATQAAISLENAQLYARIEDYSHTLEQKVAERTEQLQQEIHIRTQTEAALRESENRYKTLFENSALQLWELDLSGIKQYFDCIDAMGVKDFRRFFQKNPYVIFQCLKRLKVVRVNPATYRAFGAKSEADFLSTLNPVTLFAQDFNVVREAIIALAQGRQHFKSEFRYQRPDGNPGYSLLYLDVARGYKESLEKAIISAIDIGDRKQMESALKESESKYRALVEASQDAIWSVNDGGCYTFVNPAVQRIYGYEPDYFIGRSIADLSPPSDRDRLRAEFNRLLAEKTFFQHEVVHHTRDGKPIHLLFSGIVRRNSEGHILGATGTASDITDRKQAEIELQRAKETADAANRSKSEFLANMSHELRTPLNAILGFTQVMNRDASVSAEHQEYLEIISQSGEHLLELINNILEMAKIESGRIALYETQFDLYRLLEILEGMLQLKAREKGLWLIFNTASDVPQYIQADERKLRQVLINLLSNAIKFTQEGGVTLRVSSVMRHASLVKHPSLITHDIGQITLHFEVEDTGLGIKPEELDALFLPFAQAEAGCKAQEGTGLGLPISHRFVQLMGGEITVNSTVGRGSCFQFDLTLPSIEKMVLPTETKWGRAIAVAPGQNTYRILIADDRPESRLLMMKLMESLGLQVKEAKNGQEAVVLWETWRPHLIWMDMQMPGMDGYRATQQIKARSCLQEGESSVKTAIVALTASALDRDRTAILSVGCDDFVSKPFREEIILEKLARYLGVRYRFAEPIAQPDRYRSMGGAMPTLEFLREELSHLSDEWILQSYQAAIKGSDRILLGLIDRIPLEQHILTTVLKDWVSHFRFDRAIELLKPIAEKCKRRIFDG